MKNKLDSSLAELRRRIKQKFEPSSYESLVADDIIIEILSRLPTTDVVRCRCVCKRWRNLTLLADFIALHSRRSSSVPLILKDDYYRLACFNAPLTSGSKPQYYLYRPNSLLGNYFSHDGLIVGDGGNNVFKDSVLYSSTKIDSVLYSSTKIYNPIYRDEVNINIPSKSSYRSEVYGVFFHPVEKEYCTLWRIIVSLEPMKVQYRILNLENNPHWRDIMNPCPQNAMIEGTRPVLIDKYLYWMVGTKNSLLNFDVMEYDIRNETFRLIPVGRTFYNENLIDIDGVVSLVRFCTSKGLVKINIWTLKDHGELLLTRSQNIKSEENVFIGLIYIGLFEIPKAVACRNAELVLQADGELSVCNLKLGTCRNIRPQDDDYVRFFSHVTNLVSLRNCRANIFMGEEDEIEEPVKETEGL